MSSFVESVLIGALGKGVNKPTVIFVNSSLILGIAFIAGSLASETLPKELSSHLVVLLLLMLGLLLAFNWFMSLIGLETVEQQRSDLGLDTKIEKES